MKYYNKVDKIIVHDNNSKIELVRDFHQSEDKIAVIAHGILEFSVNETEVQSAMNRYSEKYQLKDKLVFATMGAQSYYKGTDLICDAFAVSDYLQNDNDVFLIIAGKGQIATQEFASKFNNVLVADYELSDSEFQAIMRLTDVLLLPYRKISQSGVLFTAIQNQVPFAVTLVGGIAEPLSIAPVGWLIHSPSIEGVKACLESLAEDIMRTKAVKTNQLNWDLVKEKYNWKNISIQTEQFYNKRY